MPLPVRVVKVGGSLLGLDALGEKLQHWLDAQRPMHSILVAGGGPLVDVIRRACAEGRYDDETAHWLSVRLMQSTARFLSRRLPAATRIDDYGRLRARLSEYGQTVLDVSSFLQDIEPQAPGVQLPASWDVTSDSISGRLAIILDAGELVLLKSADSNGSRAEESDLTPPLVDRFFPRLAKELPPVRLVNFRATWASATQIATMPEVND